MRLPSPIYERAPQFWMLIGLLCLACGTLLGFDYSEAFLCYALGFVSIGWSFCISVMRSINRKNPHMVEEPAEKPAEQSSEQPDKQPEFN